MRRTVFECVCVPRLQPLPPSVPCSGLMGLMTAPRKNVSFFSPVLSSNNNFGRGFVGCEGGLGCPAIVADGGERFADPAETFQGGAFGRDAGRRQMCGTPARLGCYADGVLSGSERAFVLSSLTWSVWRSWGSVGIMAWGFLKSCNCRSAFHSGCLTSGWLCDSVRPVPVGKESFRVECFLGKAGIAPFLGLSAEQLLLTRARVALKEAGAVL